MARSRSEDSLQLRELGVPGTAISIQRYSGAFSPTAAAHRHDYHELWWVRSGEQHHLIDDVPLVATGPSVTVIGRGQVHQMQSADGDVTAIALADDAIAGTGGRAAAGWLLARGGGRVVEVPPHDVGRFDGLVGLIEAEVALPPDSRTGHIVRDSVSALLLLLDRWGEGFAIASGAVSSADLELREHFVRLLESAYVEHHDAGWYADQLAVSTGTLSASLARATGRPTKELITDRLLVEAGRLFRFTDLTVQQVAYRLGYDDPQYLSRAFRRHFGVPPSSFRSGIRGLSS